MQDPEYQFENLTVLSFAANAGMNSSSSAPGVDLPVALAVVVMGEA